jgi:hypothetical protein
MKDFEAVLEKKIEEFVDELQALVRDAALAAVQDALGAKNVKVAKPGPKKAPKKRAAEAPTSKKAPTKPVGRRSPEQLSRTVAKLRAQIKANPGQSMEELASKLGTETKVLALPVKKLLARGEVRKEGVKRNTRYFPGSVEAQGGAQPKIAKRRSAKE